MGGNYDKTPIVAKIKKLRDDFPDLLDFHNLQGPNKKECLSGRRTYEMVVRAANCEDMAVLHLPVSDDAKVNEAVAKLQAGPKEAREFVLGGAAPPGEGAGESGYWWMPAFLQAIIDAVKSTLSYYMGLDAQQKEEVQNILREQGGDSKAKSVDETKGK